MIFCTGLALPEGPVLLPDGSWLATELALERGCVTHIDPTGASKRAIAKTGRPNGLAVDKDGIVWVAESLSPSIIRLTMDGTAETVLTQCDGEPLLWPNDLCIGPDGALYVTDSGILIGDFLVGSSPPENYMSLRYDGRVYRLDRASGQATLLDRGFLFTNGIAFGPDGLLYVNETLTGNVYRYAIGAGGTAGPRELFGNVLDPSYTAAGLRGPDGMAFGADGRLYVTVFGQGDVTVLGRDGSAEERIPLAGKAPTNVAFGPDGTRTIYVVEDELGQMEVYTVPTDGLPLYT